MTESQNIVNGSQPDLFEIIEALLFAGGPPMTATRLAEALGDVSKNDSTERVVAAVAGLNQRFAHQGRPYEIRRVGAGYQMTLRSQFSSILRRLHGRTREVRLSLAAIEVLSLVAYRQPISVPDIDASRGFASAAIVRQLRRRNLIQPVNSPNDSTTRFEVTRRFLDFFHLSTMEDLPRVHELDKL